MSGDLFVLDGGMGRELLRIGAPFQQPEWSALALLEGPHWVSLAHQNFIAAGAQAITTNSYALVPFHIGMERFLARGRELADLAGSLARQAAQDSSRPVLVAGSLPPLFGSYQPQAFDAEQAPALLAPLIEGLARHVDFWLAETLSSLAEARAVHQALQGDNKPRWFSFTLDDTVDLSLILSGAQLPTLRSGESIAQAFEEIHAQGAQALLFNCCQAELMEAAVREAARLAQGSGLRLGVYANSFAQNASHQAANQGLSTLRADLDAQSYLAFARRWQQAGASIIGGCCGIGPEHIQALTQAQANAAHAANAA